MVPTTTSRNISVSWDVIDCTERNGIITGYTVEFQEQGGARLPGEVVNQTFTASGLTPRTNYVFRVAGVNSNGTGPFTNAVVIFTNNEGMYVHQLRGREMETVVYVCSNNAHAHTCDSHMSRLS